jgi:hypothetical protein
MGKIKDLFYKVTRGSEALKPNDLGPAKKLNLAAKQESVPVKVKVEVVKATVGTNPGCACGGSCACGGKKKKTVTDAELEAHLSDEGLIVKKPTPKPKAKRVTAAEKEATAAAKATTKSEYTATVKKQAVKKAPAKVTEKKIAIAKDLADTPVKPVAKKRGSSTKRAE